MENEIVLKADNVSKDFLLPHQKTNSLKSSFLQRVKGSTKTIEHQHALKGVSFEVKKGEFFGIVGRNGSGKSTMLKILAEIYQPTKGSISVKGKLVPFIELGVGFNPELTGRDNVYLSASLLGFSQKQIDGMYDEIVEFAELEKFMDQKLKNYSSGMQVRLAFSIATHSEADILLIDEVLAVGDADFQRKCYEYFKSLKKNEKTIVFVTHDMSAVREYCDKAVLIEKGNITVSGTADEVADEYLKLFNESNQVVTAQEGAGKRWGNGQVRIEKLKTSLQGDQIKINAKLTADERGAEDLVFGYRFLSSEGKLIMGGNSLNAVGGKLISLKPNEETSLTFTMPNILGSDTFDLGVTVRLSDKVTVCDSWEGAERITITKQESYYPVVAPATIKIT